MRQGARALVIALAIASPAQAGVSDWFETTGAQVRMASVSMPDEDGTLRAMLEIELEPGWKTYWREPGASGVAPQVTLEGADVAAVEILYPSPNWLSDGQSEWPGYEGRVLLPLVVRSPQRDAGVPLNFDVFLGVCETICVPVQARLTLTPGEGTGPIDDSRIAAAFAALPGQPRPELQVSSVKRDADRVTIAAALPAGSGSDLFLAGMDGLAFDTPERSTGSDGGTTFVARVLREGKGSQQRFAYTLTAGTEAVSGVFDIP